MQEQLLIDRQLVVLPCISELPGDPEWEAVEIQMVEHNNRKLPRFEE
jgi:hypothetical protein